MRKWFLLLLAILLLGNSVVRSQDQVGCIQLLEDAREAYAAGMVELVPELLVPCIESGLTGTPRVEAYKLVITAYLFDYLPDEADSLMSDFLDENPNYTASSSDQAEFVQLLEAHKALRPEVTPVDVEEDTDQQVADDEARKQAEEDARRQAEEDARRQAEEEARQNREEIRRQRKQQRRNRISDGNTPRLGLILGFTSTIPQVSEPFSIGDPTQDNGAFSMAPGLLVGGKADFPLANSLEFSFELLFNRLNTSYSATPLPNISYNYHECQNRLQLPLSLALYLNPDSKTRVYLRGGIVTDYMISASAYGTRSYTGQETFLRDVEMEKTTITNTRARINLYGLLGVGVQIPLRKSFAFVETRYIAGIFLANREEYRYESQELIWLLYHVDSNFRINQLNLNVGMSWNLN